MGDNFTDIMIKLTNDRYRQLEKTRYQRRKLLNETMSVDLLKD